MKMYYSFLKKPSKFAREMLLVEVRPQVQILLLGIIFVSLFLVSCGKASDFALKRYNPFLVGTNQVQIVAHRGGAGEYPENTRLSFGHSSRLEVDFLEFDVRLTADDVLVAHHDRTVDRTSDGFGDVRNFSLAELKRFNFAYGFQTTNGDAPYREKDRAQRILTIDEMFTLFPNYKMIIEIKNTDELGEIAADLLYKSIIRFQKQNLITVASFYESTIDYFRTISGGTVTTSAAQQEVVWFLLAHYSGIKSLYHPKAEIFALPISFFGFGLNKPDIIAELHERNIAVHYWTVNTPEDMRSVMRNQADGIMTDYPSELKKIQDEFDRLIIKPIE